MGFKKLTTITLSSILAVLILYSFRPISNLTEEDCSSINGVVKHISFDQSTGDIQLELEGNDRQFYINRGMEKGLSSVITEQELIAKNISIAYAEHWSLFDPFGKHKHVAKISYDQQIIYSEFTN